MEMKILYIGDIVGKAGRCFLAWALPAVKKAYGCDLVIANAENAAGGSGLTPQIFTKLMRYGVDLVTLGDHCYKRRELTVAMDTTPRLLRPANLPPGAVGKGFDVVSGPNGVPVGVVVVMGRLYMKPMDCPFRAADSAIAELKRHTPVIAVEVHAEATSEKIAMGWHLDGKVSMVVGTHTHVPTADARILPNGTAYVTDLGMTGPYDSVLGRNKVKVLRSLIGGVPNPYDIAEGDLRIGALLVTVDTNTGRSLSAEQLILDEPQVESMIRAQIEKNDASAESAVRPTEND